MASTRGSFDSASGGLWRIDEESCSDTKSGSMSSATFNAQKQTSITIDAATVQPPPQRRYHCSSATQLLLASRNSALASRRSVRDLKRTETRVASKASIITEAVTQFATITQLQVCAQQQGSSSSSSGSSSRMDDMLYLLERWTLDEDSAKYAKVLRVQRELEDDLQAAQQQLAALKAGHDEIRAVHTQAQVERMKAEVERVKGHVQRVKMEDLFKKRINDKKGEIRNARHERWRAELTGPGNEEAVAAAETKRGRPALCRRCWPAPTGHDHFICSPSYQEARCGEEDQLTRRDQRRAQHVCLYRRCHCHCHCHCNYSCLCHCVTVTVVGICIEFFFTTPPSSITKPEKNPYLVYWPDNAQFFTDIWREPLAKQFELKADDITPQAVIAKIHEIEQLLVSSADPHRPREDRVTLDLPQGLPSPKLLTTGWANEAEMRPDIAQHLNGMALRLGAWVTFNSAIPIMTFKPGTRPKIDIVMVDGRTNTKAAVFELTLGEDADSLGQLAAYAHHAIVANVLCIAGEHVPLEKLPLLAGLAMFGLRVSPVQTTVVEFMVANAGGVVKVVANNIISIPTKNIGQAAMAISCYSKYLHAKYAHAIKQNTEHGSDFALNVMKPHVLHFNPDSGKAEAPKVLSSVANKGSGYVCKFIKTGHRAGDLRAEEIENMWKYVNGQGACSRIPATNSKSSTTNTTSSNIISSSGNGTQMIAVPHLGSTRAHIHEKHVVQLCNSLFLLSAAGLVHHDIRCANVVVSGDKASLIDFELAGCDADVMKAAKCEPAEVALRTDLPERSARIRAAGDERVKRHIEDDWIAMFYVCTLRSALYKRAPQMAHRATKEAMLAALKQLDHRQQQQGEGKQGEKEEEGHVVLVGMNPKLPQSCDLLGRIKNIIEEIPLYD
ncbi:serine/threonine protein kinase [Salpingoeca rosetta]|uniref:Serine/threonine protein kinase n=1 Tax=Salpingoeca rosetta (strain ATCC 50818 / BSB-021) TaxID=946362 RepID=F2UNG1_SALR5|nr:serine/threonine protein kinase [Salpingoeca rosetta]EGD79166.1 serine/threonine protein kinase [Salpingoeca rosetta]|eukprot:XP_004989251.1 serine/threonine protein kinase [Salpingoeca rosetta]